LSFAFLRFAFCVPRTWGAPTRAPFNGHH
jgi:hypothetical protein